MRKLFLILSAFMLLTACSKIEDDKPLELKKTATLTQSNQDGTTLFCNNAFQKTNKLKVDISKTGAGDFIFGSGWTGWIDPELVEGDIPDTKIYKKDPEFRGFFLTDPEGNPIGIACPEEGNNCGRLYYFDGPSSIPIYIGLYLVQ